MCRASLNILKKRKKLTPHNKFSTLYKMHSLVLNYFPMSKLSTFYSLFSDFSFINYFCPPTLSDFLSIFPGLHLFCCSPFLFIYILILLFLRPLSVSFCCSTLGLFIPPPFFLPIQGRYNVQTLLSLNHIRGPSRQTPLPLSTPLLIINIYTLYVLHSYTILLKYDNMYM